MRDGEAQLQTQAHSVNKDMSGCSQRLCFQKDMSRGVCGPGGQLDLHQETKHRSFRCFAS